MGIFKGMGVTSRASARFKMESEADFMPGGGSEMLDVERHPGRAHVDALFYNGTGWFSQRIESGARIKQEPLSRSRGVAW